jgi:hypothetical protein
LDFFLGLTTTGAEAAPDEREAVMGEAFTGMRS